MKFLKVKISNEHSSEEIFKEFISSHLICACILITTNSNFKNSIDGSFEILKIKAIQKFSSISKHLISNNIVQ